MIELEFNQSVWTGRIDDADDRASFRYHQIVELAPLDQLKHCNETCAIIGFSCEEGVRRNKGRLGAAKAPDALRTELAKLPWKFPESKKLLDTGTISCTDGDMETAQQNLGHAVSTILSSGATPIILGGGHETAYGHYLGIRDAFGQNASIGIVNIDAHFDLRPYDEQPSSGTMFRQILEHDEHANYFVAGIQRFGNTQELFDRADKLGVLYEYEDRMTDSNLDNVLTTLEEFIEQQDAVLLTLCTDVVNAAFAPGVSAPSPFGLSPLIVRTIIRKVAGHPKTVSFDISEVNPAVDENGRTQKLGAYFVNEAIASFMEKQ
ncbi:formimidoylglutamase [Sporosarcina contaminans]|uniref:Formimidoylglutamase n=1 Tax=Sporosarcina contaminans TaxID=633403 RepID=A0ABW3TVV0_9BACL